MRKLILLFIMLAVMTMPVYAVNVISEKADSRVTADIGCTVVKSYKHIDVLDCPEKVVKSKSLQRDVRVQATDTAANAQVKADIVNAAGNLGAGRKIVVLDTGYNYDHPDLAASYLGGKDFINNDMDPMDDSGHGSHIAGLITADGYINEAGRGIAPETKIISGKILDSHGGGSISTVIEGIYWAVNGNDGIYGTEDDFNADAISISIGTGDPYIFNSSNCDDYFPSVKTAIDYALSKGIVVVVSAGNNGNVGVSAPGCISSALTVGSVDSDNVVTDFSGKGPTIDILAPGVGLISTWTGFYYAQASGTSASTPIVAGAVALVKYAHPEYSPQEVIEKMAVPGTEPKVLNVEEAVSNTIAPNVTWTRWFDRDNPSGTGDWEHKQHFPDVCETPLAVECKTLDGVDFLDAGQDVICNAQEGLVCYNNLNDGHCKDYKVRFLCTEDIFVPETPDEIECFDGDDGQDSTVKSAIFGLTDWGARYQGEILQDHCRVPDYVNEFYCNAQGYVDQINIYCEFGCENGACKAQSTTPGNESVVEDEEVVEKSDKKIDEDPKINDEPTPTPKKSKGNSGIVGLPYTE